MATAAAQASSGKGGGGLTRIFGASAMGAVATVMSAIPLVGLVFGVSYLVGGPKFTLALGAFFVGGMFDYALFHNNPGGQYLLSQFEPAIQGIYDATGLTALGTSAGFQGAAVGTSGVGFAADGALTLTGP